MSTNEELPEVPRRPGRPRSERARRAILDAARRTLQEGEVGAVTTRKLCDEAKVSPATVYRWWPNKEAVILEAFLEIAEAELKAEPSVGNSAIDRLRDHVRSGAAFLCSSKGRMIADVVTEGLRRPAVREPLLERFYKPRRKLAYKIIQEAIRSGEVKPATDPDLLIDAIYGPIYLRLFVGHLVPTEEFAMCAFDHALQSVSSEPFQGEQELAMAGRFEIKPTSDEQFMFNLKARNGEIILTSERYKAKSGAENGVESVRQNAPDDSRYDRRESKLGEPCFVLKAANGEIIGQSEMYSSDVAMENGIRLVKENAPDAKLEDLT